MNLTLSVTLWCHRPTTPLAQHTWITLVIMSTGNRRQNVTNWSLNAVLTSTTINQKPQKSPKEDITHHYIAWMSTSTWRWLIASLCDFCSFWYVAVKIVFKLRFLIFIFAVLLPYLCMLSFYTVYGKKNWNYGDYYYYYSYFITNQRLTRPKAGREVGPQAHTRHLLVWAPTISLERLIVSGAVNLGGRSVW